MLDHPNPWTALPQAPDYVLPDDAAQVRAHNGRRQEKYRLQLHVLPEPFFGPLDAPVVLLNLNPGYHPSDVANYAPPRRTKMIRAALTHELSDDDAFYFLTDEFEGTGGWAWWTKRLNPLIRQVGVEQVRRGVQVIEQFPYKSTKYWGLPEALPSQAYTFALVRHAIARSALVVVMRSYDDWVSAVPELSQAANVHTLKNWRNVTVGPGNCPTGFDEIVERLAGGA